MKSIASKLVKIMGECAYVQKDGTNKFHNYKYASAANILEKVNESCVKHNVASIATTEIVSTMDRTTAKGNTELLVIVKTSLLLIDGDSGESVTAVGLGSGQDIGDKAVMKASTAAIKYAWMTTLNISTGDDPEADNGVDERTAGKGTTTGQQVTTGTQTGALKCTNQTCGKTITPAVKTFSEKKYNQALCQDCQKKLFA